MKQFAIILIAVAVSGCQPQPIIINDFGNQTPTIIEKPIAPSPQVIVVPPVVVNPPDKKGCCDANHCGKYSCLICRQHNWSHCTPHDHCGHCGVCRSNKWFIGIQFKHIGIGLGNHPNHHHY